MENELMGKVKNSEERIEMEEFMPKDMLVKLF